MLNVTRAKKTVDRVAKLLKGNRGIYLPLHILTYHLIQKERFRKLGIPLKYLVLPNGTKCLIDEEQKLITFDHVLTSFGDIFENQEYLLLKEYKPHHGDIVFDVGAFIGLYTLFASKCVGKGGKVYAFEPVPISYEFLIKNIKVNRINNVVPLNVALADYSGYTKLYIPQNTKYYAEASMIPTTSTIHYTVKVNTLDDVVQQYHLDRIDLLKIDVEGAELMVLKGGFHSLKIVDKIVVEAHDTNGSKLSRSVVRYLKSSGFKVDGIYIPDIGVTKKIVYARKSR